MRVSSAGSAAAAEATKSVRAPAAVKPPGIAAVLSSAAPQGAHGMQAGQLNSMVQTSARMQSIRNDPTLPDSVKTKLLQPLAKANKDALTIADVKSEQEQQAAIIEKAQEDAEAIQQAGKEIAEAVATRDDTTAAPAEASTPADTATPPLDSRVEAHSTAPATPAPPSIAPGALSSAYQTETNSPSRSSGIDTYA